MRILWASISDGEFSEMYHLNSFTWANQNRRKITPTTRAAAAATPKEIAPADVRGGKRTLPIPLGLPGEASRLIMNLHY
jgi:hypothetical protein